MTHSICFQGHEITIKDPDRLLWPKSGITKRDFINYLLTVSPYMLPYTQDRLLMLWLFPQGVGEGVAKVEKRSVPPTAPGWVSQVFYKEKPRILLNDKATLVWAASYGALEFHVPMDKHQHSNFPTELIFDLDGPDYESFDLVVDVALKLKQLLESLQLYSVVKTSGGTGLHIHVPIDPLYSFAQTRRINQFVAQYMKQQNDQLITLERVVEKRENKIYFDYLQLWTGRTLRAPYSPRANERATVAAPITWEELQQGIHPGDFTILTMPARLVRQGDYFAPLSIKKAEHVQNLKPIFDFLDSHSM